MNIRDALEADADALATIANSPTDVMRNLVHDRTVRVAEDSGHADSNDVSGEKTQYGQSDPDDLLGFVSFDAEEETVHVTQIDGDDTACRRLLEEPVRFAAQEGMNVEVLVPLNDDAVRDALEERGFSEVGFGPRFDGSRTVKFRLEPSAAST